MKEGNYQILVTIYEANELEPRGTNFWLFQTHKTACDAFVEIKVRDQIKKSSVRYTLYVRLEIKPTIPFSMNNFSLSLKIYLLRKLIAQLSA